MTIKIQHIDIQSADAHEPKHITDAVMADAGKVITPSSTEDGKSELRKLDVAELTDSSSILNKVTSVFGRTGDVVKQQGDYGPEDIGTNVQGTQLTALSNLSEAGVHVQVNTGAPAIAKGPAGSILTSNGAGAVPTFQFAAAYGLKLPFQDQIPDEILVYTAATVSSALPVSSSIPDYAMAMTLDKGWMIKLPTLGWSPVPVDDSANLALKEDKANKGIANGYSPLGSDGKLPDSVIPTSVLGQVDNIKALCDATYMQVDGLQVQIRAFYSTNDAGGGVFYWDASQDKANANGGTIIDPDTMGGYDGTVAKRDAYLTAQGTGVGNGCWSRLLTGQGTPQQFGAVGDGVADDTLAFQKVFDFASQASFEPNSSTGDFTIEVPHGRYLISSVACGWRVKIVFTGGVLAPLDLVNTRSHLIKFTGFNIIENMTIDMAYALNYDCAVWGRGRHFKFIGCNIWRCKSGWVFGDPAWENDPVNGWLGDSEIALIGCATIWAINAIRVYGQNSIILITGGSLLYSYKDAIPVGHPNRTAWLALPVNTYVNCGGIIHITSSSCCNFSNTDAMFLSKLQVIDPVAQPEYKNRYGTFTVTDCHMESGKHFLTDTTIYAAQDTTTDVLNMVNCHGYTYNLGTNWIIDAGNTCQQAIRVRDCDFYGGDQQRVCYSIAAPVSIDRSSYRTASNTLYNNSINAQYQIDQDGFFAVYAQGSNQTFNSASFTQVVMPTNYRCDVSTTFEWINSSNGNITIKNKIRNVRIDFGLYLVGAAATETAEMQILVNGIASIAPGQIGFGAPVHASWVFPLLNKGDIVTIKVKQSGNRTADGSVANFISLTGNI